MNVMERLRKDKKFRIQVVIIVVIAVLIYNTGGEKKEARTFNENSVCYHTILGSGLLIIPSPIASSTCLSMAANGHLCTIENRAFIAGQTDFCVNCVRTGYYAFSAEECCSGFTTDDERSGYGRTTYLCRDKIATDIECNSRERALAKIVQGMGLFKNDCKTAYYVAIFGGGMLFMLFMGMM